MSFYDILFSVSVISSQPESDTQEQRLWQDLNCIWQKSFIDPAASISRTETFNDIFKVQKMLLSCFCVVLSQTERRHAGITEIDLRIWLTSTVKSILLWITMSPFYHYLDSDDNANGNNRQCSTSGILQSLWDCKRTDTAIDLTKQHYGGPLGQLGL